MFQARLKLIAMADCRFQVPVFFGNSPKFKSPSLQRAPDSADSIDRLEEAFLAAKSKE